MVFEFAAKMNMLNFNKAQHARKYVVYLEGTLYP
jgi:hypothetical protein